jgi:hypothetical protein
MARNITFSIIVASTLALISGCGDSSALSGKTPKAPTAPPGQSNAGALPSRNVSITGEHAVEISYDDSAEQLRIRFHAPGSGLAQPIAAGTIEALLKSSDGGSFKTIPVSPSPLEGESADRCSQFTTAKLPLKGEFEMVLRFQDSGKTLHRAHFLTDVESITGSVFYCPMKCNDNKTYATAGFCPNCNMKLVESQAGIVEHSDHRPKHGGAFFMSSNNWHHVEGVFVSAEEFRLYVYDNFTRPLSTIGIEASAEIQSRETNATPPAIVKLVPGTGGAYLKLSLPKDCAAVAVMVQFNTSSSELFNFPAPEQIPVLP